MRKVLFVIGLFIFVSFAFSAAAPFVLTGKVLDKDGNPVAFAIVKITGTKQAVTADADGVFSIKVKEGDELEIGGPGYIAVKVKVGTEKVLSIALEHSSQTLTEVVVVGAYNIKRNVRSVSGACQTISPEQLNTVRMGNVSNALAGKVAGVQVRSQSGSGYIVNNNQDTKLSNHWAGQSNYAADSSGTNREGYDLTQENDFLTVKDNALSTFSIDVDAASYSNVRRFLNSKELPPAGAVRIEEMVNYFKYEYPQPKDNEPFSVNTEISDCPWNKEHRLALIGLQGKIIPTQNLPAANLVFLIDVSGSMEDENKLPLVKSSLKLLVDQLRQQDKVALCVYAGNAGLVLPSTDGMQKQKIKDAIDALSAGGSTAGGAGINLAYKTALDNFIKDGNNRIILCTDGDFNVGVSSDAALETLIEKKRKDGVFLTVLGFGMDNYQDAKMQKLADKGNGNHAYIDQLSEAKKVLVNEFGGTLFTIAKDVKLQVEFNPFFVQGYRLIGYENRMLAKEDFKDDTKDAGEMGSGHTVTALYEIIPAGINSPFLKKIDALKYQAVGNAPAKSFNNELMTIKLRYKQPDGATSKLIVKPVTDQRESLSAASGNYRFAAAVAEFGLLLRNSRFKQSASYKNILSLARGAALQYDVEGYRKEFLDLVKTASRLAGNVVDDKEVEAENVGVR
ncbi:vWA domain-containing protein [Ferruginibacter sp.]